MSTTLMIFRTLGKVVYNCLLGGTQLDPEHLILGKFRSSGIDYDIVDNRQGILSYNYFFITGDKIF